MVGLAVGDGLTGARGIVVVLLFCCITCLINGTLAGLDDPHGLFSAVEDGVVGLFEGVEV